MTAGEGREGTGVTRSAASRFLGSVAPSSGGGGGVAFSPKAAFPPPVSSALLCVPCSQVHSLSLVLNKTTSELAKASVSKLAAHLEMIGEWGGLKLAQLGKNLNPHLLLSSQIGLSSMLSKVWHHWLDGGCSSVICGGGSQILA